MSRARHKRFEIITAPRRCRYFDDACSIYRYNHNRDFEVLARS